MATAGRSRRRELTGQRAAGASSLAGVSEPSEFPGEVEFRLIPIPASIQDGDAGDFIAMVAVRNETFRLISGHDDHALSAAELLPHFQPTALATRFLWLVLEGGRSVGRVGLDLPHEGAEKMALTFIELHPDVWGRGIGTRALALVEQTAKQDGRSVLQCYAEHPQEPGPRLEAPTGFGSIPAQGHAARFLQARGFSLEQVERGSVLDLATGTEQVEPLLAQARAASSDYRIVSWFAPTPPEYVEGYALLESRMSTDAPAADLEVDEEIWDAERVARNDALYTEAGRTLHVVAAQHLATRQLCAFNELAIGIDRTEASHQEDTLVLREHRGHRLGLLVKCENLLRWREIAPDSPRVLTYNAEENRPMLSINEVIGFVPQSYEGAWKKPLTP